jgi:hypothetical protein
MLEPEVLEVDEVVDDADVTHFPEDDNPDDHAGDEVAFDLGSDSEGGV